MTDPRNTSSVGRRLWRLLLWSVLLLALAAAAGGWFVWTDYQRFADAPVDIGMEEGVIEVKRGDAFHHVLRRLRRAGITVKSRQFFDTLQIDLGAQALSVYQKTLAAGFNLRLVGSGVLGIALNERSTRDDIAALIKLIAGVTRADAMQAGGGGNGTA